MEFEQLMELASQQTKASQLALAKETQLRQHREKIKRLEEERQEREKNKLEKERIARLKKEDLIKEERLNEERKRREIERMMNESKNKEIESKKQTNNTVKKLNRASTQQQRTKSLSLIEKNRDQDPEEVRRLEREEKMARARAKLFDEPLSVHKKSITTKPSRQPQASGSSSKLKSKPNPMNSRINQSNANSNGTGGISTRERLQREFSMNDRKALNTIKRDRRTIEEVERDMKEKRSILKSNKNANQDNLFDTNSSKPNVIVKKVNGDQRVSKPFDSSNTSTSKRKPSLSNSTTTPNRNSNPKRIKQENPRFKSKAREEEIEESESDSFVDSEEEAEEEGDHVSLSVRDQIWKIMGKDRSKYQIRDEIFSDDDQSDEMEVHANELLEEEGRAAALARKEDAREQELLKKHELEKKKRLALVTRPNQSK